MAKTIFARRTKVTAAFLNAINNIRFTAFPNNDGELPLIKDSDLDQSATSLLARSNSFLGAFAASKSGDFLVTVGQGTLLLANGTPVNKATTQVGPFPASDVSFLWLDPAGAYEFGSNPPNDGSVMVARVTTDASGITQTDDLRPRFRIGAEDFAPPAIMGQTQGFAFEIDELEWTDEAGWRWLITTNGAYISRGSSTGDVFDDAYEKLFKRLWSTGAYTLHNAARTQVGKTDRDSDWDNGRLLYIPPSKNRVPMAGGGDYAVGSRDGRAEVSLTSANNGPHIHGASSSPHSHTYTDNDVEVNNTGQGDGPISDLDRDIKTKTTSPATVGVTIASSGQGTPFSILPPYIAETRAIFTGIKAQA